ncbi:E3 ubiquitin-protein ligase Mdm2-like isoform X2 [Dermacentor variabilis]|uniref:E3 ubiquitin-protein ligase Mdm2-like isoform X2 n=1 Tax=Dermacentor variabilis TaxID=34621 RepID=UPI003F5AFD66
MSRVSIEQLFIPKDGLMECLKTVGAKPGPFTFPQIIDLVRTYVMERRLTDAKLPTMIVCGHDPLGKVFGVERFLVNEVIDHLVKQMYAVPPQHVVSQGTLKRELQSGDNGTSDALVIKRPRLDADSTSGASASCTLSPVRLYIPPSPCYDSGPETEYSYQGHETEFIKDTSDDLWFLEESSSDGNSTDDEITQRRLMRVAALAAELLQREEAGGHIDDDCPYEVEYEIEEEESDHHAAGKAGSISSDSDIEDVAQAEILICVNDDDAQFWADSSDSYSSDSEIGDADLWQCRLCGTRCEPHGLSAVQRYCTTCWKDRFGWLPDREERHPPQKKRRRVQRRNSLRASICRVSSTLGSVGGSSDRHRLNSAGEESRSGSSCNDSVKLHSEGPGSNSNTNGSQESCGGSTSEGLSHIDDGDEGDGFSAATTGASQEAPDDWSQPGCSTDKQDGDTLALRTSAVADLCTICMARPKCGILVHGRTSHRLTCYKCALQLQKRNQPCPVCRRRIQRVVRNFDA